MRAASAIAPCELPQGALLRKYLGSGAYADCFFTDIASDVSHAEYVEAFYTTWVFKLERLILKWFVSRPSTDAEAQELATGNRDTFAAWVVEGRSTDQILLSDFRGTTRSWLMRIPLTFGVTRLYFGSAVVPIANPRSGEARMGFVFRALLGFHRLYSRILLKSAASRLDRRAET